MKLFIDSSVLYNTPSFLKGIARVADLWGQLNWYNYKKTEQEADASAIARDWCIIGLDIAYAIKAYGRSTKQPSKVPQQSAEGHRTSRTP